MLWPTELKRRVGKLTLSHRYNLLTFAAVKPWRIYRELVDKGLTHVLFCGGKGK
ncbi:MAG: hypothetical protein LBN06_12760 [Prevotellaceae bacterium]|nr:hypothetical protein [Prevotellaceae bacterium]